MNALVLFWCHLTSFRFLILSRNDSAAIFHISLLVDQRDTVGVAGLSLLLLWCLAAVWVSFSRQSRDQSGPVAVPGQEIENRIDTAVDADERPGDLIGEVDGVEGVTAGLCQTGDVVEGPRDVKRDEAHGEHHQDHDD